jgi:hypothetical protein
MKEMTDEDMKHLFIDCLGPVRDLRSGKYGHMNSSLSEIQIPIKYDDEFFFLEGAAVVRLNGKSIFYKKDWDKWIQKN